MAADGKLTIADVADHLGISKTTVSRAISGKGRVSEETRQRVQCYISQMNYKPNVIAKSLAQSKTFNIAVVLPMDCDMQELPFFQNCMCGICEAAAKRDYDVLTVYASAGELGGLERIITNHKVDGVILSRTLIEDTAAGYLKKKNIPVVAAGSSDDMSLIQVDHDHRSACRELTAHLLKQGIHNIGLIGGNESHMVTRNRYEGFVDAFRMAGLPVDRNMVCFGAETVPKIEQAVEFFLENHAECIVCMDDRICNHVVSKLRETDAALLNSVRIVSFYGGVSGSLLAGWVETAEFDAKKLGYVACNTLLDVVGGHQIAIKQLLPYRLRIMENACKK